MTHLAKTLLLMLAAMIPAMAGAAVTAAEAMAKTAAKISAAPAITVQFSATGTGGISTDGVMVMAREKFAITTSQYSAWFDGTDLYSLSPAAGEVSLTQPTEDELLEINPFDIINSYDKRYRSSLIAQAQGQCTVRLVPTSAASNIKSATVVINTTTWLPKQIEATFTNGATLRIAIAGISMGKAAVPAAAFRFPAAEFPGYDIIDLR